MSEDRPWEDYANPMAQKPVVTADPGVGYGEDIAKGAAGGLGRGVSGAVGIGGTVGNLVRAGLSKAGVSDETLDRGAQLVRGLGVVNPVAKLLTGPDASQVQKGIEDYTGKFYEPKTVPGQYASTIGEFAPAALIPGGGSLAARAVNTAVPALASETAGQITKGTAAEPYARAVAGLAAGPAAAKAITPMAPASAAHRANVATLEAAGVPLSAGQRTGNKALLWTESNAADMPFAGRAADLQGNAARGFDRAVTERIFDPTQLRARGVPEGVNLPDPRAFTAGKQSLGDEYTRLTQGNQLRSDPQLQRDLLAAQNRYERNVLPSQRTHDVEAVRNDIVDALIQSGGQMPGDVYQATRSQLGTNARGVVNQPYLAGALRDMRGALDQAMQRGLSPADAAAWALNNRRYANMKQIGEPATAAAGENLSPLKVAQTARSRRAGQYAAQQGDLDPLAKAAAQVLKPLPNSGTAARTGMQQLFNVIPNIAASSGGGLLGTTLGGPLGGLVGAATPFIAPRLATSRLGQAYLGNQALPQNARDIIAQTMVQQGITQPGGIARNQAEQEDYEKKRRQALREKGLQ